MRHRRPSHGMKRHKVHSKKKAARKFNKATKRTKAANIVPPPNRGGYRF